MWIKPSEETACRLVLIVLLAWSLAWFVAWSLGWGLPPVTDHEGEMVMSGVYQYNWWNGRMMVPMFVGSPPGSPLASWVQGGFYVLAGGLDTPLEGLPLYAIFLLGTLGVYLCGEALSGPRAGLVAAAVFTLLPATNNFPLAGSFPCQLNVYLLPPAVWALLRSDRLRRWVPALAGGMLFGVSLLGAWEGIYYGLPLAIYSFYCLASRGPGEGRPKILRGALVMWAAAMLPLSWYVVHYRQVAGRMDRLATGPGSELVPRLSLLLPGVVGHLSNLWQYIAGPVFSVIAALALVPFLVRAWSSPRGRHEVELSSVEHPLRQGGGPCLGWDGMILVLGGLLTPLFAFAPMKVGTNPSHTLHAAPWVAVVVGVGLSALLARDRLWRVGGVALIALTAALTVVHRLPEASSGGGAWLRRISTANWRKYPLTLFSASGLYSARRELAAVRWAASSAARRCKGKARVSSPSCYSTCLLQGGFPLEGPVHAYFLARQGHHLGQVAIWREPDEGLPGVLVRNWARTNPDAQRIRAGLRSWIAKNRCRWLITRWWPAAGRIEDTLPRGLKPVYRRRLAPDGEVVVATVSGGGEAGRSGRRSAPASRQAKGGKQRPGLRGPGRPSGARPATRPAPR